MRIIYYTQLLYMYTQGNHFSCNRLAALYAHVISKLLLLREK